MFLENFHHQLKDAPREHVRIGVTHGSGREPYHHPYHPRDERYIYRHEWLIFMVNVGKYTVRPMDPMGHE